MIDLNVLIDLAGSKMTTAMDTQRQDLDKLNEWFNGTNPLPEGLGKSDEAEKLKKLCVDNYIATAIRSSSNAIRVTDFINPDGTRNAAAWKLWKDSAMALKEKSLVETTSGFGYGYMVWQGEDPKKAKLNYYSGQQMISYSSDALNDIEPELAFLEVKSPLKKDNHWLAWDNLNEYKIVQNKNAAPTITHRPHGYSEIPVHKFVHGVDVLTGKVIGDIEPNIPAAKRIVKTQLDLLAIQHFNSFKTRIATGIDIPDAIPGDNGEIDNQEEIDVARAELEMKINNDSFVMFRNNKDGGEAKVTTLPETNAQPMLMILESYIKALAATTGASADALLGQNNQPTAEALSISETEKRRKEDNMRVVFGYGYNRMVRLGCEVRSIELDEDATVVFKHADSDSVMTIMTALGIAATQVGFPTEKLFPLVASTLGMSPGAVANLMATPVQENAVLAA